MAKMNIRELIKSLVPNGHFGSCGILSEHKMNKGRGANTNPLVGRVTKSYRVMFQLVDYRAVKAKAEGVSKSEVEVKPISWGHHTDPFVLVHDGTGQEYFCCRPSRFDNRVYMVDGRPATEGEIETIKAWTPEKDKPEWFMVKMDDVQDFRAEGIALS